MATCLVFVLKAWTCSTSTWLTGRRARQYDHGHQTSLDTILLLLSLLFHIPFKTAWLGFYLALYNSQARPGQVAGLQLSFLFLLFSYSLHLQAYHIMVNNMGHIGHYWYSPPRSQQYKLLDFLRETVPSLTSDMERKKGISPSKLFFSATKG